MHQNKYSNHSSRSSKMQDLISRSRESQKNGENIMSHLRRNREISFSASDGFQLFSNLSKNQSKEINDSKTFYEFDSAKR